MAQQFVCVNPSCGREFSSSERFVTSSKGLCPSCLKSVRAIPCLCVSCNETFLWYQGFAKVVGHPVKPQTLCPTCADRKGQEENPEQPVISKREALLVLPVVRIDIDLEDADVCDPQGKAGRGDRIPARRKTIRDTHGKSWEGRLDIYDFRPDGTRGFGSLARVRVMRASHLERPKVEMLWGEPVKKTDLTEEFGDTYEYLVLEPVGHDQLSVDPPAALLCAAWHGKSALKGGKSADGEIIRDNSIWSRVLTSQSRSGAHWGGTLVALVDEEHSLVIRQDTSRWRYALSGRDLEEPGFRERGQARLTMFIPDADAGVLEELSNNGFKTKVVGQSSAFVRLKRLDEDTYELPEGVSEYQLKVESVEAGGGFSSTGWSQIVCGLEGSALRPFGVAGHRGDLSCGEHGWFSSENGIVSIQTCRRDKNPKRFEVSLYSHQVIQSENVVRLVSELLYEGVPGGLPSGLEQFRSAIDAGVRKASDYHCHSLHFVQ